jgi:hypothetical protein
MNNKFSFFFFQQARINESSCVIYSFSIRFAKIYFEFLKKRKQYTMKIINKNRQVENQMSF